MPVVKYTTVAAGANGLQQAGHLAYTRTADNMKWMAMKAA